MDDDQGNAEKIIKEDALVKSGSDTEESIEMKQESEVKNADADHAKSGTLEQSSTAEDKKAPENQALNEENLHYEDGVCIYTEPESKCQFVWDDIKKEWVARDSPGSFSDKDYEYDGKTYKYTDKETNIEYIWNVDTNEWKELNKEKKTAKNVDEEQDSDDDEENQDDAKSKSKEITKQDMSKGHYGYENDTHTYTDPSDGSKYFWDKDKNAWFPKVDDDFLAQYQMSYGFVDPTEDKPSEEQKPEPPPPPAAEAVKRKAPQEPAWFDVGEESTKVYVSGLPMDITESEFVDVMQKCGLVMRDIDSGKMKVKIYLDPQTSLPKGDALCTYIKVFWLQQHHFRPLLESRVTSEESGSIT
ncbi:HIV Tat-specific factor 1 [Homalodisca vitripennis]|nr:HIV Tat-specific factor 1 [Homalodisca vitripennis]